jgi:1-pyrroline-5-carboxylate dehydrogenase
VILRESTLQDRLFKDIWAKIGANIHHYKTYPIVGETGGKILLSLTQVLTLNKYLQELFVVLLSSKDKMFSSFTSLCTTKYVASCKEQIITDVKSMKMGSLKTLVISLLQ